MKKISLSEPFLTGNESKYLRKCIETNYLSGSGNFVKEFECKVSAFTKSKYSVGIINGTSALQIALKVLNLNFGDEVLVPSLTFIATINAIKYNNCEPVFMDVNEDYNIKSDKTIEFINENTTFKNGKSYNNITKKIVSAIIVVHVWGNAANIDNLYKLCKKRNIKIIEDASESFGTFYKTGTFASKHTGTVGDIGCISFNTNKLITCGSGGMIITNNKNYSKKSFYLSTQAKDNPIFYRHNNIGYNFRLNNLNAAVGLAQIEKIKKILKAKKDIHNKYKLHFKNIKNAILYEPEKNSQSNYWMNIIKFDEKIAINLNKIINFLNKNNIEARPVWYANHLQKMYKKNQSYKIYKTQKLIKNSLCIPSSAGLSDSDITRVVKNIKKYLKNE